MGDKNHNGKLLLIPSFRLRHNFRASIFRVEHKCDFHNTFPLYLIDTQDSFIQVSDMRLEHGIY
jgi:hypothetical protein